MELIQTKGIYPGKLLLFGEHILLKGAQALAVPVPSFYGQWRQCDLQHAPEQWRQLRLVAENADIGLPIDYQRLINDIAAGLYFSSNIPQGYGLGSSGALCAGIYDRYGTGHKQTDLTLLKNLLGRMESIFHGQSSGIDPLTSYLQKPLLIQNAFQISALPEFNIPRGIHLFLADSRQPRQTGRLVAWFLEQCEKITFSDTLEKEVFPAHEAMLNAWLQDNTQEFMLHLRTISIWQLQNLHPMLPDDPALVQWWRQTVSGGHTLLKICGAGGGGFILGFTTDPESVQKYAFDAEIPLIFPFNSQQNA